VRQTGSDGSTLDRIAAGNWAGCLAAAAAANSSKHRQGIETTEPAANDPPVEREAAGSCCKAPGQGVENRIVEDHPAAEENHSRCRMNTKHRKGDQVSAGPARVIRHILPPRAAIDGGPASSSSTGTPMKLLATERCRRLCRRRMIRASRVLRRPSAPSTDTAESSPTWKGIRMVATTRAQHRARGRRSGIRGQRVGRQRAEQAGCDHRQQAHQPCC